MSALAKINVFRTEVDGEDDDLVFYYEVLKAEA
jgi:hypothetical protein